MKEDARSAVANCWPFWRARMRGSVMIRSRLCCCQETCCTEEPLDLFSRPSSARFQIMDGVGECDVLTTSPRGEKIGWFRM